MTLLWSGVLSDMLVGPSSSGGGRPGCVRLAAVSAPAGLVICRRRHRRELGEVLPEYAGPVLADVHPGTYLADRRQRARSQISHELAFGVLRCHGCTLGPRLGCSAGTGRGALRARRVYGFGSAL